jgi:hypothetical protein
MKDFCIFIIVLFILAFPDRLLSQSKNDNNFGIGISIDPARIGHVTYYYNGEVDLITTTTINQSPILFYLPINVTDKIRIEPLFGLSSTSNKDVSRSTNTTGPDYAINTNSYDASFVTIGISGYYLSSLSNSLGMYYGPRVTYTFLSIVDEYSYVSNYGGNYSSNDSKTETKQSDITFGLALGVEYFPVTNFSFSAEASFNYTSFGDPDVNVTPVQPSTYINTDEKTAHSYHTDGIFFIRWYFL